LLNKPRINNQIIAATLRVIGAAGENLGVMPREKALSLARPEDGLDLIEVVPSANPPVARLMSFDKYRYLEEKKEKKERVKQKVGGIKHVQITARAAKNDLLTKARKLEEFLNEGYQVEVQLFLRGREKANQPWARERLDEFLKMITMEYKLMQPPKFGGKGMYVQITKP